MSASVSWSCYCLFSQIQQHITGYLGVTDVPGGCSGARGRQWCCSHRASRGSGVMTEPRDLLCRNKAHPTLCGSKAHSKYTLFILCQLRGFLLVHNPLPQHKPGTVPCVPQGTKLCSAQLLWLPWNGAWLTNPSCLYLFTPWTPEFKANCCSSSWSCNLCLTHCKYTVSSTQRITWRVFLS